MADVDRCADAMQQLSTAMEDVANAFQGIVDCFTRLQDDLNKISARLGGDLDKNAELDQAEIPLLVGDTHE